MENPHRKGVKIMAGRPINYEERKKNQQMVLTQINKMIAEGIPVTKSNLERQTGLTRQSFNKGYLAEFVDSLGVVDKYTNPAYKNPESAESLKLEIEALKHENKQLRKARADDNKKHKMELYNKNKEIEELKETNARLGGEQYIRSLHERIS